MMELKRDERWVVYIFLLLEKQQEGDGFNKVISISSI